MYVCVSSVPWFANDIAWHGTFTRNHIYLLPLSSRKKKTNYSATEFDASLVTYAFLRFIIIILKYAREE